LEKNRTNFYIHIIRQERGIKVKHYGKTFKTTCDFKNYFNTFAPQNRNDSIPDDYRDS